MMNVLTARVPVRPFLFGLLLFGLTWGCGTPEQDYVDHSQDPLAYARTVKTLVHSQLPLALRSDEPEDIVSSVLGTLENYPDNPVGEYRAVYQDLVTQCRELRQLYESGSSEGAKSKIDEILELANRLPGEVHVD